MGAVVDFENGQPGNFAVGAADVSGYATGGVANVPNHATGGEAELRGVRLERAAERGFDAAHRTPPLRAGHAGRGYA